MSEKQECSPQSMVKKGGRKSRRTLTPEQARKMVEAREAKKQAEKEKND